MKNNCGFSFRKKMVCFVCKGIGKLPVEGTEKLLGKVRCPNCGGTGEI